MRGRSLALALGLVTLVGGLFPAAAALRSGAARSPEPTIRTSTQARDRIEGRLDGSSIRFQARAIDARRTSATVESGLLRLDAEVDRSARTAVWNGRGQVTVEDRLEFAALARALESRMDPATGSLEPPEQLVYGMALALSEAPVGLTLGRHEISALHGVEQNDTLQCQHPDNDGVTYLPGGCDVGLNQVCHDTSTECFECEDNVPTGCSMLIECFGRCGAGCGNSGRGWYTQDCADHDQCCAAAGGCENVLALDCRDEFFDLIDDIIFGWFLSNCAGGCTL